jgi:DNA repair exonuclease SbcCD ATPase subunit
MTSLEKHLKELTDNVEVYERRSRKRAVLFSLIIPAILLSLYLGAAIWQIRQLEKYKQKLGQDNQKLEQQLREKTQDLQDKEQKVRDVKQRLNQLQTDINKALSQKDKLTRENKLASLGTNNVGQLERDGFRYILDGKLEEARRSFGQAYQVYPTYHNVDEIYHRVLRQDLIQSYNSASASEQQSIQREIMGVIIKNYSWGMPEDLLNEMKSRLAS